MKGGDGSCPCATVCPRSKEDPYWWIFVIVSIGSVPLASTTADERNRSSRRRFWTAMVVGPLAPLALLILGDARGIRLKPGSGKRLDGNGDYPVGSIGPRGRGTVTG